MPGRDTSAKEKTLAQKAVDLDPELAEAHLALGNAFGSSYDWAGAEHELKRALALNANLALAYDASAWVCTVSGRFDEAIAYEKKALELDPLNQFLNGNLGWHLYFARRYDEAMQQLHSAMDLYPDDAFSHSALGWCLIKKGKLAEAKAEFQEAIKLDALPWYIGGLGYVSAISGDRARAEQILQELDQLATKRYVTPNARLLVYLGLGEKEQILDALEQCYQDQDGALSWLKVDPIFDSMRNEPRFEALVGKVFNSKL